MMPGTLLGAALALPIVMLLACLSETLRGRMPYWLAVAPIPALAAALFGSGGTLDLPPLLLRIRLALDLPAALLLGTAALLWIVAGVYAASWLRGRTDAGRFAVWWLLTLTGSIGVFIAADLVGFYLLFSLVSLAAYGLIVDDGTARSRRAGAITVALAVLGEAFLLLAFVMLAQGSPNADLSIRAAVAALPASPWRDPALALLILGFGVKVGMVPFHVWMPLAYRAAPVPAAAVLSGAAVKAGVIGLLRFLPLDAAMPGWGGLLVALGFACAFYGVAIGITRAHPKTVLAYSSISQMGVIVAVLGAGLAQGEAGAAVTVAFYAAHHTLVKGALFLAIGAVGARDGRRVWLVLLPAAILALGMAGLPPTGGALAKLAIKPALGDGFAGVLGSLSSAATALLMIQFLRRLAALPAGRAVSGLCLPWLVMAFGAVAVPWALYLGVVGGTAAYALSPAVVWASLWPVLLGGVLAAAWWRWGRTAPYLPDGDVVVLAAKRAIGAAEAAGAALERLDGWLRRWPVAATALLAIAAVLAGLMAGWR
jgi:formate hydrogenlyase subunit 3/multisubunit Na+/H+ antiporter MnhD subunit